MKSCTHNVNCSTYNGPHTVLSKKTSYTIQCGSQLAGGGLIKCTHSLIHKYKLNKNKASRCRSSVWLYKKLMTLCSLIYLHPVLAFITTGPNSTLGQQYTLTCNVTSSVNGTPTVQWVGPGSSAPIATGGDFTVSSTPPYTLTIDPLRQSHAGQYTCLARVGNDTGTASVNITGIQMLIIYLFSVNTFTPIERCAIIFVIAQVGKILIGQKIQKIQNRARCNRSLIGQ